MYQGKKIGLVIPTRFGSERLPGKVLMEINGKKQIERIIERALQSKYIDCVCLAISDKKEENEPIINWVNGYNDKRHDDKLAWIVGSHSDIAKRTEKAIIHCNIDIIVDVSHDCTFFDPELADNLIEKLFEYKADYASNCIVRSYPDGFDIQVYKRKVYQDLICEGLYNLNWTGWNIFHFREEFYPKLRFYNDMALEWCYHPDWHLSLDTKEDFRLISNLCVLLEDIHEYKNLNYGLCEIVKCLLDSPKLLEINKNVIPTKLEKEIIK